MISRRVVVAALAAMAAAAAIACQRPLWLPDPSLTPGDFDPHATAADVCRPGYARSRRHVTPAQRRRVLEAYHCRLPSSAFELDHLVSLELGGTNSDHNLWPEPYAAIDHNRDLGARVKDRLENALHRAVCSHRLSLAIAQYAEAHDWPLAYDRYVGPPR